MDRETEERVWRRVRGEALPPGDRVESCRGEEGAVWSESGELLPRSPDGRTEKERERLRRELDASENAAALYALLRERGCPSAECMERQRREELRQLRGEYYLCTGELPPRAERCILGRETVSLLRQAVLEEEAAAEHFARTAEGCRARQRDMYAALRSQAENRAGRMRELLFRVLDGVKSRNG